MDDLTPWRWSRPGGSGSFPVPSSRRWSCWPPRDGW